MFPGQQTCRAEAAIETLGDLLTFRPNGQENAMPTQVQFKVSKTGVEPVKVNFTRPDNVNDPRWQELGVSTEQINELAVDSLVIKIQGVARGALGDGASAVQAKVDGYKYGQRAAGGGKVVKLSADQVKTAKFSKEQLAMLQTAGVNVEGMVAE